MEKADIKIYCLKHPVSKEIRYVGMTSKSLKYRLQKHIDNALYTKHNKHLCNWINSILKINEKPIIELIENVSIDCWQEREIFYISKYPNLLNFSIGGEGNFGFKHSEETKLLLRNQKLGKKPSKETLLKRSKSLKNRIITEEHKLKIGNANKGKIYTKYKILVKDINTLKETICNTVSEVSNLFKMGEMTVRRNLNNNKIVKKKYILMKI